MGDFLRHTWDLLAKGLMLLFGFLQGMVTGQNRVIVLLVTLMVCDYVSGIVAGFLRKSPNSQHGGLSSDAGWRGLLKKAMMMVVVLLAYVLDDFVGQHNAMFESAVTWFYIGNEGISLLENLALCGVPIPKVLRGALEKLAETDKEEPAEAPAARMDPAKEKPAAPGPGEADSGENG